MVRRWLSVLESELPRLCADLEQLGRLESPSGQALLVSRLAEWVRDQLRELLLSVARR